VAGDIIYQWKPEVPKISKPVEINNPNSRADATTSAPDAMPTADTP